MPKAKRNKPQTSPIFKAASTRNFDELKKLIEAGEAIDSRDASGRTPLIYAVVDKDAELIAFLIDQGADVNAADSQGWTALHFASQSYDDKTVGSLLRRGAQIDPQDHDGNTPLHKAIFNSRGRGEVISLLLAHKANRNLKNKHGVSPLELANKIANFDVAKFLK